jgi:hypothetical protein
MNYLRKFVGQWFGLWYAKLQHKMDTRSDFHAYRMRIAGNDIQVFVDGKLMIVAPRADCRIGGAVEVRRIVSRLIERPQRQEQLALRRVLAHDVAAVIGDPDVSLRVDAKRMRRPEAQLAPGVHEFAFLGVDLHLRLNLVEHPNAVLSINPGNSGLGPLSSFSDDALVIGHTVPARSVPASRPIW